MFKVFLHDKKGGATIEYAIFLAVAALVMVMGVAVVGNHMRPQVVAWQNEQGIDNTLTGSINKDADVKSYRIYKVPPGLKNPGKTEAE